MKRAIIVLGAICAMSASGVSIAKEADTSTPEERLGRIASVVAEKVTALDKDGSEAARALSKSGLAGAGAQQILADLCARHPAAIDCTTSDFKGMMVEAYPEKFRKLIGSDFSRDEHQIRLRQTRKPVVSGVLKSVEGPWAVDFEWPIFSGKGELVGSVGVLFEPAKSIAKLVEPEFTPIVYNFWVMQTDGKIIYSRNKDAIGDDFLPEKSQVATSSLSLLLKEIGAKPEGRGEYSRPPVGMATPEEKLCIWKTYSQNGTDWRLILFVDLP